MLIPTCPCLNHNPSVFLSPNLLLTVTSTASTEWIQDYKWVLEIYLFRRPMCTEVSSERKEDLQKL